MCTSSFHLLSFALPFPCTVQSNLPERCWLHLQTNLGPTASSCLHLSSWSKLPSLTQMSAIHYIYSWDRAYVQLITYTQLKRGFSASALLPEYLCVVGYCTVGCWAAPLATTQQMLIVPFPSYDNQNDVSNISFSWEANCPQLRTIMQSDDRWQCCTPMKPSPPWKRKCLPTKIPCALICRFWTGLASSILHQHSSLWSFFKQVRSFLLKNSPMAPHSFSTKVNFCNVLRKSVLTKPLRTYLTSCPTFFLIIDSIVVTMASLLSFRMPDKLLSFPGLLRSSWNALPQLPSWLDLL